MSISSGRSSRTPAERKAILPDDCGLTGDDRKNTWSICHEESQLAWYDSREEKYAGCLPHPSEGTRTLGELELVIERGRQTYIAVGEALREIRNRKLYKSSHHSFENYCIAKWGFTRSSAYDYIKASGVGRALQNEGKKTPPTIRQALGVVEPPKGTTPKSAPEPHAPYTYPKSKTRLLRDEFAAAYQHFEIKPSEKNLDGGRHRTGRYDLALFNLSPKEIKRIAKVLVEDAESSVA